MAWGMYWNTKLKRVEVNSVLTIAKYHPGWGVCGGDKSNNMRNIHQSISYFNFMTTLCTFTPPNRYPSSPPCRCFHGYVRSINHQSRPQSYHGRSYVWHLHPLYDSDSSRRQGGRYGYSFQQGCCSTKHDSA